MITVCTGWVKPHATKILKDDGIADGKISHGMCEDCDHEVNGEPDAREAQRAAEYAAYVSNPTLDPRD